MIVNSYWMHVGTAKELTDAECAKHPRIAQSMKSDPWETNSYVFLHRSAIVDARSHALRHEVLDNDELDKTVGL